MPQNVAVRVASLREPKLGFTLGDIPPEVSQRHYSDLLAVEFEVSSEATLGNVVALGIRRLGFPEPHDASYIEFHDSDAANGRTDYTGNVVLVDSTGRAVWGNYWAEVRLDEAIRSHTAGAFVGDPRRPVVVPYTGFGDGVGIDWSQVSLALGLLWQGISSITTAYGAVELGQRISRVFRRRQQVTEEHYRAWQDRRAFPGDFVDFIRRRASWDADQLGSLLGCPTEHAEAVVMGHGFSWHEAEGRWTKPSSPGDDAEVISSLDELILWIEAVDHEGRDTFNRYARQVVAEFLETGHAPRPIDLYWRDQGEGN